jgi:N-methylhydantoinase B
MTTPIDPVTTEIIRNALNSAALDMNAALIRSAYTPIIYEAKDCSVGLFDDRGRLLGQAAGLPIFLGNLEEAIHVTARKYGWDGFHEGDVFIVNDSYLLGTHLGDVTIFSPVHWHGELCGFAATRAHWLDIGAKDRMLPVDSTEIFQEGIRIGPTRLVSKGELVQDIVDLLSLNSRFPRSLLGDMHAQIAACRMGERSLRGILDKFGKDVVGAAVEEIFAQSARLDREVIAQIPDGVYRAEGCLDDDGQGSEPVWIRVSVEVRGEEMTIDLTGSSPQVRGSVNCGIAQTISACRVAFKMLVNPNGGVTGGTFQCLKVVVPEGSVVSAQEPAACQFYFTPLGLLIDLIVEALAPAIPQHVAAAHYGDSMMLYLIGSDFVCAEANNGGWGGNEYGDGESALANVVLGDSRNLPVELIESKYPVSVRRYMLECDSGGPGKHRGGLGTIRELRADADDVVLSLWFERSKTPAWGLLGGEAGRPPGVTIFPDTPEEIERMKVSRLPFARGSIVRARAGGGGGFMPPHLRDALQVLNDVIDGYVSIEAARDRYGVVIDPNAMAVDWEATAALRAQKANNEGANTNA